MKGFILAGIVLFSANVFANDYTKVTCTSEKARRALMDTYNEMLKEAADGLSVTDMYDVKIITQTEKKLVCKGLVDYSTGDEGVVVNITLKDNSFGELIVYVKPEFDDEE